MLAVLIFGPIAVLTARVRQHHGVIVRLLKASAVAVICGHFIFSVAELAVRTRPIKKGYEALRSFFKFLLL